jgi:hypothetical protein
MVKYVDCEALNQWAASPLKPRDYGYVSKRTSGSTSAALFDGAIEAKLALVENLREQGLKYCANDFTATQHDNFWKLQHEVKLPIH